jgi:hypothetical protein
MRQTCFSQTAAHRGFSQAALGPERGYPAINRNILYLVIGVLAVAAVVLGYQFYQERQKAAGIQIDVGKGGISIETK